MCHAQSVDVEEMRRKANALREHLQNNGYPVKAI